VISIFKLLRRFLRDGLVGVLIVSAIAIFSQFPVVAKPGQLVDVQTLIPRIQLDIRYATVQNFTQRKLYSQAKCLLRPGVAARLAKVQADLAKKNLGLKVYDCYRPLAVQKKLWEIVPNPAYVANPAQGSRHNRGSAVDLTLVDLAGRELQMPTEFDEFSERAHLDYMGGSAQARQNRVILQQAMKKRGFVPLVTEWWHFDDPNWQRYSVLDIPFEQVSSSGSI